MKWIARDFRASRTQFPQFCYYYHPQKKFGEGNIFKDVYRFMGEVDIHWYLAVITGVLFKLIQLRAFYPPPPTPIMKPTGTHGKAYCCVCKGIHYVPLSLVFFRLDYYCNSPDYVLKMNGMYWKINIVHWVFILFIYAVILHYCERN